MVAATERLTIRRTTRPAAWDALMPSDPEVNWQVWAREKGPGYWVMRWATNLARLVCRAERALGRKVPDAPTNPNGLEDGGTFRTREEAEDLCRIIYQRHGGRYAVTYTPVLVGRAYPLERVEAAGDRYFDPFKVFDFSATDAVREQASRVLVSVEDMKALYRELGHKAAP